MAISSRTIAPDVLHDFRHSKILATIGPATHSRQLIQRLIESGTDGIRLNCSHGTSEERAEQIKWARSVSEASNRPVAVLLDLQGPKVRLGDIDGIISCTPGQTLKFGYRADFDANGVIPSQYDLAGKVRRGQQLLLADGRIKTQVTAVKNGTIFAEVLSGGDLTSRKGINLPDTDFGGDIFTEKDRRDIAFGAEHGVDYVALSFVQSGGDMLRLKRLLQNSGSEAKTMAKIETKAALDNIDEIIAASDSIMIARGDLATEVSPEAVPVWTRLIIEKCRQSNTLVIVATQMLLSMVHSLEPTRAEASVVATAAVLGADALMLSEETASGQFPIEVVQTMARIISFTESKLPPEPVFFAENDDTIPGAISSAVITLAHQVEARVIVAETATGRTALNIAARRPQMPMVIVTPSPRVANQLSLLYGGLPFQHRVDQKAATKTTNWLKSQGILKAGDTIVTASGQSPGITGGTDTVKVRIL